MTQVGTGKHTYELVRDWPKMRKGQFHLPHSIAIE